MMDESSESVRRYSQRTQRINYHLLNDGSDEEAPLKDRIAKRPRLLSVRYSIKPITPDDSSSHRT